MPSIAMEVKFGVSLYKKMSIAQSGLNVQCHARTMFPLLVIGHYSSVLCLIMISAYDLAKLSVQTGSNQFVAVHVFPRTIGQSPNLSLAVSVR